MAADELAAAWGKRGKHIMVWRAALFIMLAFNVHAYTSFPDDIKTTRPHEGGPPTEVKISVFITNLVEISVAEESFRADFVISSRWNDPRLADPLLGNRNRRVNINDIWHPQIGIVNQRSLDIKKDTVLVNGKGDIEHIRRYFGNLFSKLDLGDFPFDSQKLLIKIYSSTQPGKVMLQGDADNAGILAGNILSGWVISDVKLSKGLYPINVFGHELKILNFSIHAKRLSDYYLWKLFLPLSLIALMSWLVFWINPIHFEAQLGLSTASVFTLTAFLIQLGKDLPEIGYLTRADIFIVGCMFLVFSTVAESVLSSRLSNRGKEQLAIKLDIWARWIYFSIFILLILFTGK